MPDRVIQVSMQAQVANYVAGMKQVASETSKAAKSSDDAKAKFEAQNQAMTGIGVGLLAVGAAVAVGVGLSIKKFAEFDQAMSEVQASTHESAANMSLLRDAAIEAGAKTVFSATQAANAIDELAKAGISAADILGGALDGALTLASAGGLGVAEAASIAATALTQFKLKGADIPHVADLLAAGAGKAQGSVDDLSQALNQGGLVASQAGFSIEETTGVLAAFASAGLKGSDAGTSLKTAILALQNPSTTAKAAMDKYGISVYDSNGKMKSFSEIAGVLTTSLGDQSDEARNAALATIFGNDAVRAASVLYSDGAKGIEGWNKKVNDSGYAAETARIKLDNLNGDLEQLGGSFDTALIKSGSAANGVLRGLTQAATEAVNAFGAAPPIIQGTALVIGAVTAAALLAGGAFLVGVPKLAQFQAGLVTLKDSTMPGVAAYAGKAEKAVGRLGTAFGVVGRAAPAIALAAVGLQLINEYLDSLKASADELQGSITGTDSALDNFSTTLKGKTLNVAAESANQIANLNDALKEMGHLSQTFAIGANTGAFTSGLTEQSKRTIGTLQDLGKELAITAGSDLPSAQRAFRNLGDETDNTRQRQWELLNSMGPEFIGALIAQAKAAGKYTDSMSEGAKKTVLLKLAQGSSVPTALEAADAYLKASDVAGALDSNLQKLLSTINEANGIGQDAVTANIAYRNALAGVDDYIAKAKKGTEGYTLTLDQNTQAGRDNMGSLVDTAKQYQDAAAKQFALDHNTQAYVTNLQSGRDAVLQRAKDLGATDEQIKNLSDHIVNMPTDREIQVTASAAEAQATIDGIIHLFDGKRIRLYVDAYGGKSYVNIGANGASISPKFFASGGVTPAGATLAVVGEQGTEFVSTAQTYANPQNRAALEYMHAGGTIRGYASGGPVGGYVRPQYAQPSQHITYQAPASAAVPDRPIMMDGSLFGVLKTMANGEATIVLNTAVSRARAKTVGSK